MCSKQEQILLSCIVLFVRVQLAWTADTVIAEEEATKYLEELEPKYSSACSDQITARWNYVVNVTKETEKVSVEAQNKFFAFQANVQKEILQKFTDWREYKNEAVRRELQILAIQGTANMSAADVATMNEMQNKMESSYAKATVCEYKNPANCNLHLDPEIEEKLRTSTDYDELSHYWSEWHNVMGREVRPNFYSEYISYQNKMARANGFQDMGEVILENYNNGTEGWDADAFKIEMHNLWESLRPYYNKLHAYVRFQLRKNPDYTDKIKKDGLIPAQLFGNMWAQSWTKLEPTTKPFPDAASIDVTGALQRKGYTVEKIFKAADEFFTGLGIEPMTPTFWEKSVFVKPTDRDFVCHPSAEDMCTGVGNTDFRIKMCTQVDLQNLVTVHHEMGHIAYFMQYTNLHYIFRNGANPGFQEALGDALALAVTTPKHLKCVLELDLGIDIGCEASSTRTAPDSPTDFNFLYQVALEKIPMFAFAISMDSWRWEAWSRKIQQLDYNIRWWEIRKGNQGIIPPTARPPTGFGPAAKYHTVANVGYLRYFLSFILQFQFYEALCVAAGEYTPGSSTSKPLYQCDFAGNAEAGKKLSDMMKVGFSKPWPEALSMLTGGEGLSIEPLVNYFKPLFDLLDERLAEAGETPGFSNYL